MTNNIYIIIILKGYLCVMKEDIRIKNDEYNFHFRVAAIVIQNSKILVQKINECDYYILPGGHVLLGESSIDALKRELKEEIRYDINIEQCKLFCFHENFYNKNERTEHWIENYFTVKTKDVLPSKDWEVEENDDRELKLLHFKWVSIEELRNLDLKPVAIKKLLIENKINDFSYIIDK